MNRGGSNWAACGPNSYLGGLRFTPRIERRPEREMTSVEHGMMGSYTIVGRGAELQQMGAPWQNMS
jgi:hypothetical protein